jgi:hypothetical protein
MPLMRHMLDQQQPLSTHPIISPTKVCSEEKKLSAKHKHIDVFLKKT